MTQNAKNKKLQKCKIDKTGEFMQEYFQAFSILKLLA